MGCFVKALWIDPTFGISGDMFNAAMLDLARRTDSCQSDSLYIQKLGSELEKLNISGFKISDSKVKKVNIVATVFNVTLDENELLDRKLTDILETVESSGLSDFVKSVSKSAFILLGQAEAAIHGVDIEDIHFHEIGALDSIVDIVSAAIMVELLEIEKVFSGPIGNGSKGIINNAHGKTFSSSPAAIALQKDLKSIFLPIGEELSTPTGVAILSALRADFNGDLESFSISEIGYGAGSKDFEHPNVLRVILGETDLNNIQTPINWEKELGTNDRSNIEHETVVKLSTNLDDLSSELLASTVELLFESGVLDCWVVPIMMKKGRPAFCLNVLCQKKDAEKYLQLIFLYTGTLGVRLEHTERFVAARNLVNVYVDGLPISIKVSPFGFKAEYEDILKASKILDRPVAEIKKDAEYIYLNQNRQAKE